MEEQLFQTETLQSVHPDSSGATVLERLARRAVLGRLSGLRKGRLTLEDWTGRHTFGAVSADCALDVRVTVHNPATYTRVAAGGTIGAGEAYFHGDFDCDDLTGLMRLFVINRATMQRMERGASWLRLPLHWIAHRLRKHDRAGSRSNIAAHYDLGNAFFSTFLDRRHMMYSSAYYADPADSLEQAAEAKLALICRKLELRPEHHVLDIGGGWGGFSIYAARTHGCRVTMTTISAEQYRHARDRVVAEGLEDRVTVLNKDYRDLDGTYDRIVSIEMIEAIGYHAYGEFFATCDALLKPGGAMLIQAITIAEPYDAEARRTVDFIQRYVFPGGALPSLSALSQAIGERRDLMLDQVEDLGLHYARTLRHWLERVQANRPALSALGCDKLFLRLWEFYLCYCEAGFLERSTGLVHLRARKPLPGEVSLAPTSFAG